MHKSMKFLIYDIRRLTRIIIDLITFLVTTTSRRSRITCRNNTSKFYIFRSFWGRRSFYLECSKQGILFCFFINLVYFLKIRMY